MQELIRLQDVTKRNGGRQILKDYNLCLCKGEIWYIQDSNRQGKEYLKRILTGREQIDSGTVCYKGKRLNAGKSMQVLERACFAMENQMPVVEEMSIAENLAVLKPVPFPFRRWDKGRAEKTASDILKEIGISHDPKTLGGSLGREERIGLCIAKAVLSGVELIILNDPGDIYRESEVVKLGGVMRQYAEKGISFLILANKRNAFYEMADRIQVMRGGRDLMEWRHRTDAPERVEGGPSFGQEVPDDRECAGKIVYMIDREWSGPAYGKAYLEIFKEHNPDVWSACAERLPERTGDCRQKGSYWRRGNPIFDGETAQVPYNSAELLLDNLSLEDNISVCIPGQTKKWGAIHEKARKVLKREFFERIGRKEEAEFVQDIGLWERKALSVYRWELARPRLLLIDNPFTELNVEEIKLLDTYLGAIRKKKTCAVIFLPEWNPDIEKYDLIVSAKAGKEARIERTRAVR